MKKFLVTFTRNITESCTVEVQAENEEEANTKAETLPLYDANWKVDDDRSDSEPYITDTSEDE